MNKFISVCMFSKAHGRRLVRPLACRSPQSALADEISAIPGYYSTALPEYVAKLPPCFSDHPVVQACLSSPCTPLGCFLDGVGYTKRDSIIGFLVVNLATQMRHLVCTVRKRLLCRCGCGGWDTLRPIYVYLDWCFRLWRKASIHQLVMMVVISRTGAKSKLLLWLAHLAPELLCCI